MQSFVLGITTFILSGYGVTLVVLGTLGAFLIASLGIGTARQGFISMGCGGAAFLGAFLIRTYMTGI